LIDVYPEIKHHLFERTLDELDAARDWMLLLGRKSAEEKVASFLLMLARRRVFAGCSHQGGLAATQFELSLRRMDMADFLGLTIETISRQLTRLKAAGIIRMIDTRTINVPDVGILAKAAGREVNG
jgi:CRP/FNR family transcriptional regulator